MSIQSLIIDCDPGVDDAVALFLAFAAPELELLAITTVGGNVPGAKTQRNARIIRQIAGREDVPVFGGAERPLKRPPAGAVSSMGRRGWAIWSRSSRRASSATGRPPTPSSIW